MSSNFTLDNANALGAGGYGKVVTAKNNQTGERVAAKLVSTSRMKKAAIQKEIDLMGKLQHTYIVGLRGQEQIAKNYVIYMELASGGELFSRGTLLALATLVLFGLANGIWARSESTEWWEDPYSYCAIACVALGMPSLVLRAAHAIAQYE